MVLLVKAKAWGEAEIVNTQMASCTRVMAGVLLSFKVYVVLFLSGIEVTQSLVLFYPLCH